ncbi:MAG: hypothetical protein KA797_04260 [Chitinophagales bacterium]|nr:hypothetical protein [Chitinophagales bacterium]
MKYFFICLLGLMSILTSCKKESTSNCACDKPLEAKLAFIGEPSPLSSYNLRWKAALTTGEYVELTNIEDFKLEERDQFIRFCTKEMNFLSPGQIAIECIEPLPIEKNKCDCKELEWIVLEPLEVTCMALDCPQFKVSKANGEEIVVRNLNQFKLKKELQKLHVCFEDYILESYPPQYTIKCVENYACKKECGNEDKIEPNPCDKPIFGTVLNKEGAGGCKWMIQLEDGSLLNAVNLGDYPNLTVNELKITFAFKAVDEPNAFAACNLGKPIFVICGKPIEEKLKK